MIFDFFIVVFNASIFFIYFKKLGSLWIWIQRTFLSCYFSSSSAILCSDCSLFPVLMKSSCCCRWLLHVECKSHSFNIFLKLGTTWPVRPTCPAHKEDTPNLHASHFWIRTDPMGQSINHANFGAHPTSKVTRNFGLLSFFFNPA